MNLRAPLILWVYIFAELWKLVFLTTAVLVTVIAFAAAVKPLADGKLGPEDTLRFMLLAMVPMLQYALPFSACFGATLAYHRLAADNELTAAYAGGIGHRAVLFPAVLSGLLLGGIVLGLSNQVIPLFLQKMAELVTMDAAKLIVTKIERGEALEFDGTLVYADKVIAQGADPSSGAYERLWMGGLLVVKLNEQGAVESQASATNASVWLRRTNMPKPGSELSGGSGKAMTEVIIKPTNVVGVGQGVRGASTDTLMRFFVPNAFSDNVKFLSFSQLNEIKQKPERMERVDRSRRVLAAALAERDVIDAINADLQQSGEARFTDPFNQQVVVKGAKLRPTRKRVSSDASPGARPSGKGTFERDPLVYQIVPSRPGQPVIVDRSTGQVPATSSTRPPAMQRQSAAAAYLRMPALPDPARGAVTITVQLYKVATQDMTDAQEPESPDEGTDARGELEQRPLADLVYTGDMTSREAARPAKELLSLADGRASKRGDDEPALRVAAGDLRSRIDDLLREVLSKEHERYAMSIACCVMVLLGSVMAMRLRDALPLTVYLWAFFPALASTLAVSGGQQLTHGHGPIGLLVLYAGVGVLGCFGLFEFARLVRH